MEGLPKLPGLDFKNRLKLNHHVAHSLDLVNGYRIPRAPPLGIGKDVLNEDSIAYIRKNDATLYDAVFTYGRVKQAPVEPFRPHFVRYDKVKLTFKAFFKQSVPESGLEHYRIRLVNIMYFMDDDTMTVIEPKVENCGFPQGRLVRRGKIPKNINGEYYYWKDLNIGIDIDLFGIVYHITDCDEFTRDFMIAQGVELNDSECSPVDSVELDKKTATRPYTMQTPTTDDKLRRYLEFQGKVLSFDCVLDESDRPHGECITYKMYYYLEDDTVAIKELKENQEGRDHFPMFMKRTKLPRDWKRQPASYPACLEVTDNEVTEYYQPTDFRIGNTIYVYGRRFLLLDCDPFTRKYYANVLKSSQNSKLKVEFPKKPLPKRPLPEYLGFGTPEDSRTSCLNLHPKTPKKDIIRYLVNANKYLRFGCVFDTAHPEDKMRHFVLKYSLADGTLSLNEPPIRNSGIQGGKFLSRKLVVKPGCDLNAPEYYTAKDFYIGAMLTIHSHRFKIISADLYVYRYMKENPELFSGNAIAGVRDFLLRNGYLKEDTGICKDDTLNRSSGEKTPDLNDRLENIHYFPDEQPFQEPFDKSKDKDASRPYQLVENEIKTETVGPSNCHDEFPKLPRHLNKNVHFAEEPGKHD
ncbi:EF-hand domain-containing protein 1-like [Bradysia coprophila]|uniref:EF-hand domain-containing protein 1-like n=1 Tax=Bradysia coprophila TaxID=38358 RepID=UPI00187DB075|nr:EF-hand domain-containing protein 1-like [Bradysia coprophila]